MLRTPQGPPASGISAKGINKFGAGGLSTGARAVWDNSTAYTFSSAAAELHMSSSSGSDTVDITIVGLDANWNEQTVTETLQGQTETTIGSGVTWQRVFRAYNASGTALVGNVYIYEDDTLSSGVPDTTSLLRARISIGNGQTLMAVYTIPLGYTGHLHGWWYDAAGVSANETVTMDLVKIESGGVPRVQSRHYVQSSAREFHNFRRPLVLPAKTDIYVSALTSSGSASATAGFDIDLWPA